MNKTTGPHFVLYYDTSPFYAENIIKMLEAAYQTYSRYCRSRGLIRRESNKKLRAVIKTEKAEFLKIVQKKYPVPRIIEGLYSETDSTIYLYKNENDPLFKGAERELEREKKELAIWRAKERAYRRRISHYEHKIASAPEDADFTFTTTEGESYFVGVYQARILLEEEKIRHEHLKLELEHQSNIFERTMRNYEKLIKQTRSSVAIHEAVHMLSAETGPLFCENQVPTWLKEGLSMYFEEYDVFNEAYSEPLPNRRRLNCYLQSVKKGETINTELLLTAKMDFFESLFSDPAAAYAQSWALFYYLNEKYPQELTAYMNSIAERGDQKRIRPAEELNRFRRHFPITPELLEKELRQDMRRLAAQKDWD